jgi:hypothetical protein
MLEECQILLSLQKKDLKVREAKLAEEQACDLYFFNGRDLPVELEELCMLVAGATHTARPRWPLSYWRACLTIALPWAQHRRAEHGLALIAPLERRAIAQEGAWFLATARRPVVDPSPWSVGLEGPPAIVWL